MVRKAFDIISNDNVHRWGRVRKEADKITMTVKEIHGDGIEDTYETEIEVDDFDKACAIFEACNIKEKAFQENLREEWRRGDVEDTGRHRRIVVRRAEPCGDVLSLQHAQAQSEPLLPRGRSEVHGLLRAGALQPDTRLPQGHGQRRGPRGHILRARAAGPAAEVREHRNLLWGDGA